MNIKDLQIRLQIRIDTLTAITYNSDSDTGNDGAAGALHSCLLDVMKDVVDTATDVTIVPLDYQYVPEATEEPSQEDADRLIDMINDSMRDPRPDEAPDFSSLLGGLVKAEKAVMKVLEALNNPDMEACKELFSEIQAASKVELLEDFRDVIHEAIDNTNTIKKEINQ